MSRDSKDALLTSSQTTGFVPGVARFQGRSCAIGHSHALFPPFPANQEPDAVCVSQSWPRCLDVGRWKEVGVGGGGRRWGEGREGRAGAGEQLHFLIRCGCLRVSK